MRNLGVSSVWLRILASFSIVVLSCGLKNYLAIIFSGTGLCPYLCPSVFATELFFSFPFLERLFEVTQWANEQFQSLADMVLVDPWNLTTSLLFAPVYEEVLYRGPMYLTKEKSHPLAWWLVGLALSVVFVLSHGRNGLALIPLFVLSICSLLLIATTNRFWPSIALHFIHNFFFSSALVYQSLFFGD
jgi:membrane protease YdiL (CAAX protease family)